MGGVSARREPVACNRLPKPCLRPNALLRVLLRAVLESAVNPAVPDVVLIDAPARHTSHNMSASFQAKQFAHPRPRFATEGASGTRQSVSWRLVRSGWLVGWASGRARIARDSEVRVRVGSPWPPMPIPTCAGAVLSASWAGVPGCPGGRLAVFPLVGVRFRQIRKREHPVIRVFGMTGANAEASGFAQCVCGRSANGVLCRMAFSRAGAPQWAR